MCHPHLLFILSYGILILTQQVTAHGHGHGHGHGNGIMDDAESEIGAATVEENERVFMSPGERLEELERKWGTEWGFSGISTFAHLPYVKCLVLPEEEFDIAIVGVPFDTATSYRPGARFGPRAIRAASSRQTSFRGFNARAGLNPYTSWARILDCGDIPITPFDNGVAVAQMTAGYKELLSRKPSSSSLPAPYFKYPKLITLGGDHSLALPALRALTALHGEPIAVLHFDSHLDTWAPTAYPNAWPSAQSEFTHGSMFWLASLEGLIENTTSVHAGLRTRLSGTDFGDYASDTTQGFHRIHADDIDEPGGVPSIIATILARIGTTQKVYLSVDIDVLDPGLAPGTGTPEPGGWTTRELIRILRGVQGLNVVGADVVEVAPAYDGVGEQTSLAAAQVVFEILTSMVARGLEERGRTAEREEGTRGRDEL